MKSKIFNPVLFQGKLKKKNYFEGWYFKMACKDKESILSLIPGVSLSDNDRHCFIQYIYTHTGGSTGEKMSIIKTGYIRYDIKEFVFTDSPFSVEIGKNRFTLEAISIDIESDDVIINGNINLSDITPIKKTIFMPNIMGYFAYIPKMECYHGVVSMNHILSGSVTIEFKNEQTKFLDFNGGKGYIEKDWGTSFPSEYVWGQCNNFKNADTALMFSVANIPFAGRSFKGFLCNIVVDNKEYRFATYNKSKITSQNVNDTKAVFVFENKRAKIMIKSKVKKPGELIAPVFGTMERVIKEGLSGETDFILTDKITGKVYDDSGVTAGIEIVRGKL